MSVSALVNPGLCAIVNRLPQIEIYHNKRYNGWMGGDPKTLDWRDWLTICTTTSTEARGLASALGKTLGTPVMLIAHATCEVPAMLKAILFDHPFWKVLAGH
jgi:hypothetical protein